MTALQDWLSIRSVDPKVLKTFVCDALKSLTAEEPKPAEPVLLQRGLERC